MSDTPISKLLANARRPLLSFEFFPPKSDADMDSLKHSATQLLTTEPDFVTCTYGAGGSTRQRTLQVCEMLRELGYKVVMPHLTCVGSSRMDLLNIADEIYGLGYRNIMALRGDPPRGDMAFRASPDGLSYGSELVDLLKTRHSDFCLGVAAYPETHPEAMSPEADIEHLKEKFAAGAEFATTQLFFDNKYYFDFVKNCREEGLQHPILPGLLPAISLKQVQRMCAMCKTALPEELARELEKAGADTAASEAVGMRWAVRQMEKLFAKKVPGIHLYVLNRASSTQAPEFIECLKEHRG